MTPRTDISQLLTYEEVASILQLHPQTLRQWVSNGKFPHLKIGVTVRFSRTMIEQYIQSSLVGPCLDEDLQEGMIVPNLNLVPTENDPNQEKFHDK